LFFVVNSLRECVGKRFVFLIFCRGGGMKVLALTVVSMMLSAPVAVFAQQTQQGVPSGKIQLSQADKPAPKGPPAGTPPAVPPEAAVGGLGTAGAVGVAAALAAIVGAAAGGDDSTPTPGTTGTTGTTGTQ
jgi:hypothetical protein